MTIKEVFDQACYNKCDSSNKVRFLRAATIDEAASRSRLTAPAGPSEPSVSERNENNIGGNLSVWLSKKRNKYLVIDFEIRVEHFVNFAKTIYLFF